MASISKDSNGTKRVEFTDANRKRRSIRLGKTDMKIVGTIKTYVEKLVAAQVMNVAPDAETARWVANLSDDFHAKLARTGLIAERRKVGTLGEVIPEVIKEKSIDAKPATIEIWEQAEESLYRYFGKDRRIDTITEVEAKEFSIWLTKQGSLKESGPLKQTTVYKRMQHAIAFFHVLVRKGVVPSNPFTGLAKRGDIDETRNKYIDEETILKVMEYAPDAEWRLIIALWRFAGLRAVSEVLSLKWEDVLWDQKLILVRSPKTEHHEGKGMRKIPFFPHIEECLMEAAEQADEGAVYVVEKHAPLYLRGKKERPYVARKGNIGTTFKKIILRAGFIPWKKLIHNLRASFETDLLNGKYGKFGLQTIATWLGHSVAVMLEHYGRIQKEDYDKIAQACQEVRERTSQTQTSEQQKDELFAYFFQNQVVENQMGVVGNAPQHTAEWWDSGGNRAETPIFGDSTQPLEITALRGKKRQEWEPHGTPSKPYQRRAWDSNPQPG